MVTNEETEFEEPPNPRSAKSMAAFDRMPKRWRVFCANYPRTAPGGQLAGVLADCDYSVPEAKRLLQRLLPARIPKRKPKKRPMRTYR
jgi:hypothetical protein